MRFADSRVLVRVPEKRKKEGIRYALSPDGIELPVIDLGHSAFRIEVSEEELAGRMSEAVRDIEARRRAPPLVSKIMLKLLLRGSLLAKAVSGARGGYVSGMGTYLLKLGPENLGGGYAKRIDRAIASSLPCLSARLRLAAVAELLALSLRRPLIESPGAELILVALAGGPAVDCLNALLAVRREGSGVLEGRRIRILVLDRDTDGPAFGGRALAALTAGEGPLSGLDVALESRAYDWDEASTLPAALGGAGAIVALSSEGGLFEYGSDEAISANLRAIRRLAPGAVAFVGTMSKAEGEAGLVNRASGAALRFRSLGELASLAEAAGWAMGERRGCPLAEVFALRPEGPA